VYVRVASWEGVSPEAINDAVQRIEESDGPPEGVPAKRLIILGDEEAGKLVMIPFFETEDDRATANETLKTMDPPGGLGAPSVDMLEVKVEVSAPE
jgi:hypothetical protein